MTFRELIDLEPQGKLNLAEFIQLFLLGYDDKIYIDIKVDNEYILEHIRIIDEKLAEYYELPIHYFEDSEKSMLCVCLVK